MTDYQAGPEGGEYLYPGSGDPAPRVGAKVQLLTIGGAHTNGPWRDDGSCLGWLPLPKRNMEKEDMTDKITIERETLQAAIDALECALSDSRPYIVKSREVSTTLRAALAAQSAEPVAVMWLYPDGRRYTMTWVGQDEDRMQEMIAERGLIRRELYAAPAAVPPDERIEKALRRAFDLGQKYWQQIDMLKAHGRDVASIEANFERHVESFFEHGTSPDMAVSGYGWEPT